jgi:iron complex transport system substrate-binding protein
MIELSGGSYVCSNLETEENALSTTNMQMEDFYLVAKDADYLIYNSTIDGEVTTIDQLLEKSSLLSGFKAVQNGNVWCTSNDMFQQTTGFAAMMVELHEILTQPDLSQDKFQYFKQIN